MYRTLDPQRITGSLAQLNLRIEERFPGAGLAAVCAELEDIAAQTAARVERIGRPAVATRTVIALLMALGAAALFVIIRQIVLSTKLSDDFFSTVQGIDASFNIIVLMSAAVYFLMSYERRRKRSRALRALHEIRSIMHVIDMHQLTKDPAMAVSVSTSTPSSPYRTLTQFELSRYLDYCSEMLSLAAKIAVLYAQSLPDAVVIDVVNDIERTAASLAQKIWQKITIVESTMQHQELMAKLDAAPPPQ